MLNPIIAKIYENISNLKIQPESFIFYVYVFINAKVLDCHTLFFPIRLNYSYRKQVLHNKVQNGKIL